MSLTIQKAVQKMSLTSMIIVGSLLITSDAMGRMSIYDGAPSEDQCRLCHGDNSGVPNPAVGNVNADRHHSRIGKPIEGLYYGLHDTVAPGDTSRGEYHCLTCHLTDYSEETGEVGIVLINDCLQCHPAWSVMGKPMRGANVHHATESFQRRQCRNCHGFLSSGGRGGGMGGGMGRGGRGGGGGMGRGGRWGR